MAKVREFGVGFENLHPREFVAQAKRPKMRASARSGCPKIHSIAVRSR